MNGRPVYAGDPIDCAPDGYVTSVAFLRLPGMTYRKLDYWTRTHVLHAAADHVGSGYKRLWPADEVGVCAAILRLCSAGIALDVAARIARKPRPLAGSFEVVADLAVGLRLVLFAELWQVPE